MKKATIRYGVIGLAVCAACLGLTGCAGGGPGSEAAGEPLQSAPPTTSHSQAPQAQASASGDQADGAESRQQPDDVSQADSPPPAGEEERGFYGRVVSIGDALYTAELQMNGELVLGTHADLEQWDAAVNSSPDALYLDCRVDVGFDLTREQMDAVLSALRSMELDLWTTMEEAGNLSTENASTVAALDARGSVMWKVQTAGHWVMICCDGPILCFAGDSALDLIGALAA